MQYKCCVNCEHLNVNISIKCNLKFKELLRNGGIRDNRDNEFRIRDNEFRIAELSFDDCMNPTITKNPNFIVPDECPYKLEHLIS